ncbi:MAG: hypothetical protein JSR17_10515 [Proteobacteria bacterium]|nr:hypothetical protein [Pseudomonadota bacterium]
MRELSQYEMSQIHGGWVANFGGELIKYLLKAGVPPLAGFALGGLYAGTQYAYNQTKDYIFAESAQETLDPMLNTLPAGGTWLCTTLVGIATAVVLTQI